jgi:hypothetical protein
MIGPTNLVRMDVKSDPPLRGNPLRRGLSSTKGNSPSPSVPVCQVPEEITSLALDLT